jgi:HdeA/HdeB family
MRRRVALAITAAIALQVCCLTMRAQAQTSSIPCDAFAKNADGSWTVLTTTYIEGPNVKVQQDAIVQPGRVVLGYDIAAMIAKACPNAVVAPPPGAAPSAAAPVQQAPPLLARYADANGNIDVRQLTCGHLNEASAEEAQLLLAWYSGWYNGLAKGRGINLARVRYNIRNVVDYCKVNRDKKLTDALERMLK